VDGDEEQLINMATRLADAGTVSRKMMTGVCSQRRRLILEIGRRPPLWFRYTAGMVFLALLSACQLAMPIPQGQLDLIAKEVCRIGHPGGTYVKSSIVGISLGLFEDPRSVDVAISYTPIIRKKPRTMTVRFTINNIDPCEVRTDVISDTGPTPVLLDNQIASPFVGQMVCNAMD
jgi:hypothetical protein